MEFKLHGLEYTSLIYPDATALGLALTLALV